ncbi:MAG: AI-2E family transporter [Anaerolineae bacterium]|nr:AI-2E family transporter [Anaerolineae bacterium]
MGSSQWSRTTKLVTVVSLIVLLLLVLYLFRGIVLPVVMAVVLAYILKPLVDFLDRKAGLPRTLAALLVYATLLVALIIIVAAVVPFAVEQVARLNLDAERLVNDLVAFLSQPITIFHYTFGAESLVGDLRSTLQNLLRPFATQTFGLVMNVASSLFWIIAILVISFYLVRDAGRLRAFLDQMAPPGHVEELGYLREEISQVWKAFLRGQMVLAFAVGMAVWLLMTIVGLPNAELLGLLAGLLEVVPNFGPILATIPALIIALFRGSTYLPLSNFWFAVLVVSLYTLVQQVESAFLVPRIMGRRMQLPPVIVFIGVLAGGLIAGVLGILLAAPVLGTLRVLLKYVYAKLLDQEPFPDQGHTQEKAARELYPGEIDAILFDLDGTLVETDDAAVSNLARRLRPVRWLFPRRDPVGAARSLIMTLEGPGNSLVSLLDRLGLDDNLFSLGDRLRRLRGLSAPPDFRAIDGAGPMLKELSRHYRLGIVTTRSRRHAQAFLEQQSLTGLVQVIAGREDTYRLKPHPGPLLHAAKKLGVPIERCLMVGDTTADIGAARAAGARAVGVLCGFGQRQELEQAGADLILDTTADLGEVF